MRKADTPMDRLRGNDQRHRGECSALHRHPQECRNAGLNDPGASIGTPCMTGQQGSDMQGRELVLQLMELGQEHLFAHWPAAGKPIALLTWNYIGVLPCCHSSTWWRGACIEPSDELCKNNHAGDYDDKKAALVEQLKQLNANYPGGLQKYVTNAKRLLEESKSGREPPPALPSAPSAAAHPLSVAHFSRVLAQVSAISLHAGKNAFEGYVPSVPEGEKLDFGSKEFRELEDIGESTLRGLPRLALPLPAQTMPDAAHSKLQGTSSTGPCARRAQQGQVTSARPNTGATTGAGRGWPLAHHTGQTGCDSRPAPALSATTTACARWLLTCKRLPWTCPPLSHHAGCLSRIVVSPLLLFARRGGSEQGGSVHAGSGRPGRAPEILGHQDCAAHRPCQGRVLSAGAASHRHCPPEDSLKPPGALLRDCQYLRQSRSHSALIPKAMACQHPLQETPTLCRCHVVIALNHWCYPRNAR